MPEENTAYEKFTEQLPMYVNGTLEPQERVWMASFIQSSESAQRDLQFAELMRAQVRSVVSPVDEPQRLSKLLAQWQRPKTRRGLSSLLQPLVNWAGSVIPISVTAIAVVSMVVVGQVAFTVYQGSSSQTSAWRGERIECADARRIRVIFVPDASMGQIVQLLQSAGVTLQDGPSESGEVWLKVNKDHAEPASVAVLRASPLVDDVFSSDQLTTKSDCKK